MAKQQVPNSEGVKDIPSVPGSLAKGLSAPLGPVGSVPESGGDTNRKVK
jgi:hypothetical protein